MARRRRRITRRTRIVWAAFAAATTLVTGVLILGDGGAPRGLVAASQGTIDDLAARRSGDPVQPREAALDRARWKGIVIHHSGSPVGDPDAIERQHLSFGYASLGYHFVIGNGHGYGDGVIHVGPRWNRQQPGAHVAGGDGPWYNEHAIGICLVGNGDRRPFTDRQLRELVALVRRLQQSLGIPAGAVHLHADLAAVNSPGRYFPAAEFEAQLLR
ncbi:MAG TPA: peptidoglycan recognition family protein [Phycisphaerales bacterium]|nr:peptidoglycan recognition family protein [Phycisphaerales bacterium]HMP38051.1 peptidoglycan recognition family protein [Phycisphaerales bacterium]